MNHTGNDVQEGKGDAPVTRKQSVESKKRSWYESAESSIQSSCSSIKLFATEQDMENRGKHTTVLEKASHPSWTQCITLREVLGLENNYDKCRIQWIVIANYMIDFAFLLTEVPELLSIPFVTIFCGIEETRGSIWKEAADKNSCVDIVKICPSDPAGVSNPLGFTIPYGVHHSKIFLIGFLDGTMRLVIHTANLRYTDIHLKAQGLFYQDFPLKSSPATTGSCVFEEDLISYFDTYGYTKRRQWLRGCQVRPSHEQDVLLRDCLRWYDFSSASAVLIASTPGYHRLNATASDFRGHLKLRDAISKWCPRATDDNDSGQIVCQFSSMGSLSERYLIDLSASMDKRLATIPTNQRPKGKVKLSEKLRIVYPTVQEIKVSVEGYSGGGSVPGPLRNVQKGFLRPVLCRWSATDLRDEAPAGSIWKGQNVPHIKTYYQMKLGENFDCMEWFVLTSHNLSKAAWGEVQHSSRFGGRRLFVRHWELGVFVSPALLNCDHLVPWSCQSNAADNVVRIPLPYPFRPSSYRPDDHPWAVDQSYSEADRFGRTSCFH